MGKKAASGRGGAQAGLVEIDPEEVYFTHARIRPFFSCGRRVHDTLDALTSGELAVADLPPISLIGSMTPCGLGPPYFSLNNRRLFVFKELRRLGLVTTVAARIKPPVDSKRERERYTVDKMSLTARLMVGVNPTKKGDDDAVSSGSMSEDGPAELEAKGKAKRGERKRGKQVGSDAEDDAPQTMQKPKKAKTRNARRALDDDDDLQQACDGENRGGAASSRGGKKRDRKGGSRGKAQEKAPSEHEDEEEDTATAPKTVKHDWKAAVGDVTLYSFDYNSLGPRKWIRDAVISAWFELLVADHPEKTEEIGLRFVDPSMTFLLLHSEPSTTQAVFEPIIEGATVIYFVVNNSTDTEAAVSGSHWSLLQYSVEEKAWTALDSAAGMNDGVAQRLVTKLLPLIGEGTEFARGSVVQQRNDYDCGIHAMINAAAAVGVEGLAQDAVEFRMALKETLWRRAEEL
eukprot:TRINITY_DN22916_c0_g1_i1.p1 TRINITY_DN22916_c0_g1~~TRINITY_DN22916_c0_g1_i1.p1  ORF type:complete len:459 (+),score=138.62 TRINITY_DN22916_c0_g1_i1:46-1422(+)